jgi:hypothetical protein
VTDVFVTSGYDTLQAASQHFIWNDAFLRKRLEYKPNLPLYAIFLRAYRLPSPIQIPDRPSYAGCKSWVHLTEEIDVADASSVLTADQFAERREALLEALHVQAQHGDLAFR